jgi:hypothetical protein
MTLAIEEPQYPPGAPTGLSATVESGNNVRVSWTAPILNASQPEVVSYRVLVTSSGLQERDVVVQGTQYLDAGLEHGREYHYEVFARNSAGEGAGQIVSVITSPPESIFVPQAPQLHVSTGAAIELSWEPPERNASTPPITSYRVYRGVSADTLLLLGDVGNVSNFTDPSAQSGVGYWYSISAVNEAGEGAHSAAMPADILSAPKPADQGTVLLVGVIFIPAVAIVIFAIVRRRK